ncbi:unnamed protein product [Calypogeia fissa]
MDLFTMFVMAALPVLKIFITCGFGAYLGHPSVNILTEDGRKLLNKLVVVAFTPAFVFTKLALSVSFDNILAWWYMPINICLCFFCGLALGMVVLKNTTVPPRLRNLVLACCAAGNTGNVPLVLVPAICEEDGNPFGRTEACTRDAVAYVSYGMWVGITLTWTVVYRLLQPPDFQKNGPASPVRSHGGSPLTPIESYGGSPRSSDFGEFREGGYETEEFNPRMEKLTVAASAGNKQKGFPSGSVLPSPKNQVSTTLSPRPFSPSAPHIADGPITFCMFYFEKHDLKKVFNPPTCAAILGVIVGGIPLLKSLCEGPFLVFIESGEIIGQAMIPAMNMVLGATLVQGTGVSELEMPAIIGTILVRLVANPILGMIFTKIAYDLGMLPPDPLFRFVLMVQFTMPTAINIGTLAQLFGVGEKESALVLFYAYMSASVFMTFWICIYLNYVF